MKILGQCIINSFIKFQGDGKNKFTDNNINNVENLCKRANC